MIQIVLMMITRLIMTSGKRKMMVFTMTLKKILFFKQQFMLSTHAPNEYLQTKK